jgi:hypothetical protein
MNSDPSFTRILAIVWKTVCALALVAVIVAFLFYVIASMAE